VINYEVPHSADAYVHRVGRTGRAEATGTAVTLVAAEELPYLHAIERSINIRMRDGREA
jgi:superfamily II DNA/RNA helicase